MSQTNTGRDPPYRRYVSAFTQVSSIIWYPWHRAARLFPGAEDQRGPRVGMVSTRNPQLQLDTVTDPNELRWPSVFWQFFWAWVVAPSILWRARRLHDTQGWRTQTIACCLSKYDLGILSRRKSCPLTLRQFTRNAHVARRPLRSCHGTSQ